METRDPGTWDTEAGVAREFRVSLRYLRPYPHPRPKKQRVREDKGTWHQDCSLDLTPRTRTAERKK